MASRFKQLVFSQIERFKLLIEQPPAKQFYAVVILASLITVKFLVLPSFELIQEQRNDLQQLANVTKSPNVLLEQQQKMSSALESKKLKQEQWGKGFYQDSESNIKVQVVNKLQKSAKERDLLYLRSRWLKTPSSRVKEYETLEPLLYTVLIRGDYNEIKALIEEWQSYQPLIQIDKIRLRDRKQPGLVSVTFTISVYRLR